MISTVFEVHFPIVEPMDSTAWCNCCCCARPVVFARNSVDTKEESEENGHFSEMYFLPFDFILCISCTKWEYSTLHSPSPLRVQPDHFPFEAPSFPLKVGKEWLTAFCTCQIRPSYALTCSQTSLGTLSRLGHCPVYLGVSGQRPVTYL